MRRESDAQNTLAIREKELEYTKKFNAKIYFLNDDAIELSSSEIRGNIEDESVKKLLSPDVLTFINKNGLYRNE
jgi:nicotinic acid mononucleotide adenylyltransferase